MVMAAGIDLGGTKIETALFDHDWQVIKHHRINTPKASYNLLLDTLAETIGDIDDHKSPQALPIGIGIAGLINPITQTVLTANLPATGRPLPHDLINRLGRDISFINDCRAFTLSEAHLGAGRGYRNVVGIIIGTGLSSSQVIEGQLVSGLNGIAGEIGHTGLPANFMSSHNLPLAQCGCGRIGCFETLASGPGLTRIAKHLTGSTESPANIVSRAAQGDSNMTQVYTIWCQVIAHLIDLIMLAMDPDIIILGGGLSKIANVTAHITQNLEQLRMPNTRCPRICLAEGGDSSGTRGAALMAHLSSQTKQIHQQAIK